MYVWIYDPVHFKTFAMGLILGKSGGKRAELVEWVGLAEWAVSQQFFLSVSQ